MKKNLIVILILLVPVLQAQAQSVIKSTMGGNEAKGESYVVLQDENGGLDTIEIYFSKIDIIDYIVISNERVCYVVKMDIGFLMYKKAFLGSDGFWDIESAYSIGGSPLLSAAPRNGEYPPSIKYTLVGVDSIEKVIRGEKSFVDLKELDRLGFSSHPKNE